MLVSELILFLITIYMSIIYGILYLFFEAFPISYQEERGWGLGVGALPFLSLIVGVLCGVGIIITMTLTRYKRKFLAAGGHPIPEERLVPMTVGGILYSIGLFWFAWTSDPDISWVPQVLSGIPIGAGTIIIFMQCLSYIIDCYLMYANSAIAANTILRSIIGAAFPLFATSMYHDLGVQWATTLLALLTVACLPCPILFYRYGVKLRQKSKHAPTP